MSISRFQSSLALALALGLSAGTLAPMTAPAPVAAQQQTQFSDVSSTHWASQFIVSLTERNIIAGFPDGTFRPEEPVTRAQYAAMVRQAFNQTAIRGAARFVDVPAGYWATAAINEAYAMGFMSGYPNSVFRPTENIPRAQVLVSLANGLGYTASAVSTAQYYQDAGSIPAYAVASIAAATERQMVVNYPNVRVLNPNRAATRAEVAAFIYQALASQNRVAAVGSPYVVATTATSTAVASNSLVAGTTLAVAYDEAEKIVVLPNETAPLTLRVAQAVTNSAGQVLIPAGSQVVGELRPSGGGCQFVAQELVLAGGRRVAINAASQVVTRTETIRRGATTGELLAGAVLGSSAAAAIASVTGDGRADTLEVLAGTAVGTVASVFLGRDRVTVIAINPNSDLTLTVNETLALAQ